MKGKKLFLMLMLACLLCFTACEKESDPQPSADVPEEEVQDPAEDEDGQNDDDSEDEPLNEDSEDESESDDSTPIADPVSIIIYYCNDDATDFASEEVQIASLSESEVLKALIDKGVLPEDVQALSFENVVVDGKNSIDLDLNDAFTSYISSIGSTGEYYAIGGICNTFLDAYDCEQIKITVEGRR